MASHHDDSQTQDKNVVILQHPPASSILNSIGHLNLNFMPYTLGKGETHLIICNPPKYYIANFWT